jgi:hypothetical protein
MNRAHVGGPPPTFPPGSLGEQILQFLQAQNWPNGTPAPPAPPGFEKMPLDTIRLVEISVILDRLLQAINSFQVAKTTAEPGAPGPTGGGGSPWPPH